MHAVVGRADSPPAAGQRLIDTDDAGHVLWPVGRIGDECPHRARVGGDLHFERGKGLLAADPHVPLLLLPDPAGVEVRDPATDLPNRFECLVMPRHANDLRVKSGGGYTGIGEECIRAHRVLLDDAVLEETMGNDHVGPRQLLHPVQALTDE